MKIRALWTAMAAAGLLTACGGGGGDGATAPTPTASVSLSGVAAKGLMANARVEAIAVRDDGTLGDVLASGSTDANGQYTLGFTATRGKPYVIRVTAQAGTTHRDEVTGTDQPLPEGFAMRALFVPVGTGTVTTSASITPFSELAAAAAASASGGITAANAAQAVSTVEQLLGFDPTKVVPTTTADTNASLDQQKLAVLLAAVSKLADDGALGCAGAASAGEKTECVVEALAAGASTTTKKLESGSTDISAALSSAVTTVLADPELAGSVDGSFLTEVQQNLACTTDCAAAAVTVPGDPTVANAIAAAKALLTQLRSDWATMFARGGVIETSTSTANSEAFKFRQAMSGIQVPAQVMVQDLGALLMGIDLYNDVKAGRDSALSRGRAEGEVPGDLSGTLNAVGCTLYQDSATTIAATGAGNANFIGCSANYHAGPVNGVPTRWRHGFSITPNGDGSFGYLTRARRTSSQENASLSPAAGASPYAGTVTTTLDGAGSIVAFSAAGDLAAAFTGANDSLANDHHSWEISGTRTIAGFKQETSTLSGAIRSWAIDPASGQAAVAGTLSVKPGSQSQEVPVAQDGSKPTVANPATQGMPAALTLNLLWATAGAEFEGTLAATDSVWDAQGVALMPTKATLAGVLRNVEAGVARDFISGSFSATVSGFPAFDATLPVSATNTYTVGAQFVGSVTAPNRPKLELTLASSVKAHEDFAPQATLNYKVYANGAATPRTVIAITADRTANGDATFTLSEATSKLSLRLLPDAASADLLYDTTLKIGQLDTATSVVTFTDNSFVSLAGGL